MFFDVSRSISNRFSITDNVSGFPTQATGRFQLNLLWYISVHSNQAHSSDFYDLLHFQLKQAEKLKIHNIPCRFCLSPKSHGHDTLLLYTYTLII